MAREIILDTETTGFDPKTGDRLVEIGCIEVVDFMPTGRSFHEYCDPLRDMPAEAEKVHGLSSAFLTGKPKFHEVADRFIEFVGDSVVVVPQLASMQSAAAERPVRVEKRLKNSLLCMTISRKKA